MSSDADRFCGMCGAPLQPNLSYCPKCGAAVSKTMKSSPTESATAPSSGQRLDWREQRREERAQRRADMHRQGRGFGALIVAAILIVAGLGIFLPSLPWQFFWGAVLILIGVIFVYFWLARGRREAPLQQTQ